MKTPKYQHDLSLKSPILLDKQYKQAKIDKMLSILGDTGYASEDGIKELAIDIGCSGGLFVYALAPYYKQVFGLDIDTSALKYAKDTRSKKNVQYLQADSQKLPFPDQSVDLILCNHVYEHVPDATVLFSEIYRVMKSDGICYLGAASRLTPIEPHYHLAFLSWLPKPLAHLYMRMARKGDYYYENLRTFWGIKALIKRFEVDDFTLAIIQDPDKYKARDLIPKNSFLDRLPVFVWKIFYWVLPSYIFILRKIDT